MQNTQMTLIEYVLSNSCDAAPVSILVDEFLGAMPPSLSNFPNNNYVSDKYKEKSTLAPLTTVFAALIQKTLQPIHLASTNYNYLARIFGYFPDSKDNAMKCHLFSCAATYKFAFVGDCSFRASYAALNLAKVFSNCDITVALLSEKSKDQYVVMLGNNKKGWFVYDPLTNPELVFELNFYKKEILPTFRQPEKVAMQQFKLVVTKEIAENFNNSWQVIKTELINLLNKNKPIVKELLQDPDFTRPLVASGIIKNDWTELTNQAIKLYQSILENKLLQKPTTHVENKSNKDSFSGQYGTFYCSTKSTLTEVDKAHLNELRKELTK